MFLSIFITSIKFERIVSTFGFTGDTPVVVSAGFPSRSATGGQYLFTFVTAAYSAAITSISTSASFGRRATSTAERAG